MCVYKIRSEPASINMHADSRKKKKKKANHILTSIIIHLNERFAQCIMKIHLLMQSYAFIIQLKCEGMKTDFMFRPHRVNLAQSRGSKLHLNL